MQINIRKWNKNDIPLIADLESEIFSSPWTEKMLEEEFNNPIYECLVYECIAAENELKLIAYAGFYYIADEIHISNIAVKSGYRRNNTASQLLEKIIEIAGEKDLKGITLEVNIKNTAAISLYKKYGFKEEGIRKKYYNGTNDALIMWKYF